jgi:hypothetical protein
MLRAISVALTKSLCAPVEISSDTISSAARPPTNVAIRLTCCHFYPFRCRRFHLSQFDFQDSFL